MTIRGSADLTSPVKRASWRAAAFGALAAVLCTLPAPVLGSDLAGLWLIEPDSFDAMVDNGLDLPSYPLLVIRDDHVFRLYRVYPRCAPLDAGGEEIRQAGEPCYRAVALNGRDELGA